MTDQYNFTFFKERSENTTPKEPLAQAIAPSNFVVTQPSSNVTQVMKTI